jgi:hypothetical protein
VSSAVMKLSSGSVSQPSSAAGSPASPTALQENVRRLVMTVTSQENLKKSFGRLNPDGSLLRMSRGYAQANLDGFLESSCMIFPKWGIVSGGVAGELSILEPVTEGNGSSSLPTLRANDNDQGNHESIRDAGSSWKGQNRGATISTAIAMLPTCRSKESGNYQYANGDHKKPTLTLSGAVALLPTPQAYDSENPHEPRLKKDRQTRDPNAKGSYRGDLKDIIFMLPTPTSRDHKDTGNLENVPVNALLGRELGKNHGLKLQPAFAEWMQGFPIGWTELSASEIPSSRNKSTRSSKPSQMLKKERKNP